MSRTTVKEIVGADPRTAAIFEKYSIDFCCGGGKTVEAACAERGVDPNAVHADLQALQLNVDTSHFRPNEWELDTLADFIVNNHHLYVRRMVPVVLSHLQRVVEAHGSRHPELPAIEERFQEVAEELTNHMRKEEGILFPVIKALVSARRGERPAPAMPFGTLRNPISMMEREHQSAGDVFSFIRQTTSDYTPPADACTTYRVTLTELEEFERDLHQHVHLENNILFPKAIELEDEVLSVR